MELRGWSAHKRGPRLQPARQRAQCIAFEVGRDAACLREYEKARRHVEDADRHRRAESVEAACRGMRDRKRHRAEDADLARSLGEPSRVNEGARCALERDQLQSIAALSRHYTTHLAADNGLAAAPGTLPTNRGPGVAGDEVDDAAGDRVADEGPIEEREHHAEERDALLGVEAAVDGVDQHEGVIGAEPSVACL